VRTTLWAHNLCGNAPLVAVPHDHEHGSILVYRGEQVSAARGDLYLLIVDVTVCKVTPVILHGAISPES